MQAEGPEVGTPAAQREGEPGDKPGVFQESR